MSIGFSLPFTVATGSLGYFEVSQNELDAVRNDIQSLLITNWGERVMHYNFGCNLIDFLFEPKKSVDLKREIADRINDQMSMWLPFVLLEKLNILFTEDMPEIPDNGIGIAMEYRLTSKPDLQGTSFLIVT